MNSTSNLAVGLALSVLLLCGADWASFRGPGGAGVATDADTPSHWGERSNVAWKTALPGFGGSSPITWQGKIFVTCYNGYGLDQDEPGDQADLRIQLLCLDAADGSVTWAREIEPRTPERDYRGFLALHGYASNTPATDGEHVFVFAGQSGVYAFTMQGKPVWNTKVGDGLHGWGSATSVVLCDDLVIVNASVESNAVVALSKADGSEVWRHDGIARSWSTPLVATSGEGRKELLVSMQGKALGLDPATGEELWQCKSVDDYVCPAPVAHDGVAYITGGRKPFCMAVRLGGNGDVTDSHVLWQIQKTPKVATPLFHDDRLYWIDQRGNALCVDAKTGDLLFEERMEIDGRGDRIYASLVLGGERLYGVSRLGGIYVLAATDQFDQVAHNDLGDDSVFNATPAIWGNQLIVRSDRYLYAIGK